MKLQIGYSVLGPALAARGETDPLALLEALAAATDLTAREHRYLRSEALHALLARVQRAIELCDFRSEVSIRPDGVFVEVGGVWMESTYTAVPLRSAGEPTRNQGEALAAVLARRGISVSAMVDVGANFGEIALWFKRQCPHARVLAVEPSSLNVQVLYTNLGAQSFSTDGLEIVHAAIGDHTGTIEITHGIGPMVRVVPAGSAKTETVACERLDTLLDTRGLARVDFMKIDIEGSEPLLREAVSALGARVRAYYIEFSQFAPLADYIAFAQALLAAGFECFDEPASTRLRDAAAIERCVRAAFQGGPLAVANLWFFASR